MKLMESALPEQAPGLVDPSRGRLSDMFWDNLLHYSEIHDLLRNPGKLTWAEHRDEGGT